MIPIDWLQSPFTPAEVEEDLAVYGAPDLWLRQWRALLERSAAGDELWEYCGADAGFDSETADFHSGFAFVREGEVVDWIEEPP